MIIDRRQGNACGKFDMIYSSPFRLHFSLFPFIQFNYSREQANLLMFRLKIMLVVSVGKQIPDKFLMFI